MAEYFQKNILFFLKNVFESFKSLFFLERTTILKRSIALLYSNLLVSHGLLFYLNYLINFHFRFITAGVLRVHDDIINLFGLFQITRILKFQNKEFYNG